MRVLLAVVTAFTVVGCGSSESRVMIHECAGVEVSAPTTYVLTCADANARLERLEWTTWGGDIATAKGVVVVNDCDPTCAAGTDHEYGATVETTGREGDRYVGLEIAFEREPPPAWEAVTLHDAAPLP